MRKTSLTLLASATLLFTPPLTAATLTWTEGHGDIGMGYEDEGGGSEVLPHWHIEGGTVNGTPREDEEFAPGDLFLLIPNNASTRATRNSNSIWNPIGVAAGETFWRLSSNSQSGVPYMGWSTEELIEDDWIGEVSFTLTGLIGPGDVSVYYFPDGELTFLWASSDGISLADTISLAPGLHEHFNMAFTAQGLYEVEITMSGTHVTDGFVSATDTFAFNVVPEPSAAYLCVAGAGLLLLRRWRKKSCR